MSAAHEPVTRRVAIMQPYFLPYLGYFQLIDAVDTFVVYDDVNYIKGGWINRNRILGQQGGSEWMTLQTAGASPNKLINEVAVGSNRPKLLQTIRQRYAKAPQFDVVYPIINQILTDEEGNLARFLFAQLELVSSYLGIVPDWQLSSALRKDNALKAQAKVIAICKSLGATEYINAIGGKNLYVEDAFAEQGIRLSFIESRLSAYPQLGADFIPHLSIVDVLMFNEREACRSLLHEYSIVR
ncbi:MAG: WbqC family protein [Gammaproteobacteria bacterium]|nr:WbqC family protein [Gammaproteobacteria bacterium]